MGEAEATTAQKAATRTTMNTTMNQVRIKIFGELAAVKATVQKIETLYPVFIEGQINLNDQDNGVHVFLTVPVENNANLGQDRQVSTQTATTPQHNFSMSEATSK